MLCQFISRTSSLHRRAGAPVRHPGAAGAEGEHDGSPHMRFAARSRSGCTYAASRGGNIRSNAVTDDSGSVAQPRKAKSPGSCVP